MCDRFTFRSSMSAQFYEFLYVLHDTLSEQRVHHEEAEEQHRGAEVTGEGQVLLPRFAGMSIVLRVLKS